MKKAANIFLVLFMILALSLLSTPGAESATRLCNNASLTPLLLSAPEVKAAAATAFPDLSATARYVRRTAGEPGFSERLDWPILALAGAGESAESLIRTREGQVRQGQLFDQQRSTDFHRTIIGAVAAGKDPRNFGGYNLIAKVKESQLQNGKFGDTISGGERLVNAHIWGILSLYAAGEPIPNRSKALSWLINKQNADGGFSVDIVINNSDVDMTGMALMAFAALGCDSGYPAVKKALGYLQSQQQENGDFSAWNSNGPESIAQVIHGLVMLGIDPAGPGWTRKEGSPLSALLRYRRADGSFGRRPDGEADFISTYQALAALGDLERGESIYTVLHRKNAGFTDLLPGDKAFEDVKELVSREVLSGYPDGTFRPNNPVRRDEFAKMITTAMGKEPRSYLTSSGFDDVSPSHWACPYIRLAVESGLITGKAPRTFAPGDNISGAEGMTILIRALGEESRAKARPGEPWYGGFIRVAREKELLYLGFDATQPVTRAQCAYSLMRLLEQI